MYFLWSFIIMFSALFAQAHTNMLIHAQSPYLLSHAHNPVNWIPYSPKIFAYAQKEHKLIFLSIGYSTCHWCHVMEKESFENESLAKLLNKDYICVKVDKEEMPQIDIFYQHKHSLLNHGRNGWPLTIFLTPNQEIIYSATYIPLEDNYGVEGMKTLIPKFSKLYQTHDVKLLKQIEKNQKLLKDKMIPVKSVLDQNISAEYIDKMQKRYDKIYKGFDARPRFPLAANLRLLMELYLLTDNQTAWTMLRETLDAMAMGGIYDQVEGGFFRYTTDQDWVVPHYEKMLYTNAELIPIYTRAYSLTKNPLYKKVVLETIGEYYRHFEKNNLFYGASDADTKGVEGGYFIYSYDEVAKLLQKAHFSQKEIEENLDYCDITSIGNFQDNHSNVQFNTGYETPPKRLDEVKKVLNKIRQKRTFPFVDKKIITAWNAMMIRALFKASAIDQKYTQKAVQSLHALLDKNYKNGVLYHQSIADKPLLQKALLEDYAFLIDALLEAYMHTYDKKYLHLSKQFITEAKKKFYIDGIWYLNEDKPHIKSHYNDKYYTTALARMFENLLTYANLTYDVSLWHQTKKMLFYEKEKILQAFDKSPEALSVLIRLEYGSIVLKSSKKNLWKNRAMIAKIRYPFLYTKVEKTKEYLLCNMESCFYYDKNLTKVTKKIKTP